MFRITTPVTQNNLKGPFLKNTWNALLPLNPLTGSGSALTGLFIRPTFLVLAWTPSSWHRFKVVLETFPRCFAPCWHGSITQVLQICQSVHPWCGSPVPPSPKAAGLDWDLETVEASGIQTHQTRQCFIVQFWWFCGNCSFRVTAGCYFAAADHLLHVVFRHGFLQTSVGTSAYLSYWCLSVSNQSAPPPALWHQRGVFILISHAHWSFFLLFWDWSQQILEMHENGRSAVSGILRPTTTPRSLKTPALMLLNFSKWSSPRLHA